ncbi:MAG: asparaginase, partial [Anaerolineales bacterium]
LLTARQRGQPEQTYLDEDHPLQREILRLLAQLAVVPEAEVAVATDGCSAPNFALPLRAMALAFARLADPSGLPIKEQAALNLIYSAMTKNPVLISGPGKLDAVLMQHGEGRLLAKEGAEGVLCLAHRQPQGKGLGVAIKIWDGDRRGRARAATALELIAQLGWLSRGQQELIRSAVGPAITTRRDQPVGEVRPVFQLGGRDG